MTIRYNETVECHRCRALVPTEQPFCAWVRDHPGLGSDEGIVRFDLDILLHRYMFVHDGKGDRTIQAMMFIEVKTFEGECSLSQRDTLFSLHQVLRNRVKNIHRNKVGIQLPLINKVWSIIHQSWVTMFLFGGHLLRLQYDTPARGWIEWSTSEGKKFLITEAQLVRLLRFEINPDTLKPMDIRRRSGAYGRQAWLFQPETNNRKVRQL